MCRYAATPAAWDMLCGAAGSRVMFRVRRPAYLINSYMYIEDPQVLPHIVCKGRVQSFNGHLYWFDAC
jgi:hypothetical protein